MNNSKHWVETNNEFLYTELPNITEELPVGIYELDFDEKRKDFFLIRRFDKFLLPDKIYDVQVGLMNRVTKTFHESFNNFGIILKGLRGTGKTVFAKQLSNELNLPVILVTKPFTHLAGFINGIDSNAIILFDEFEKIYNFGGYSDDEDEHNARIDISNLLTLMDGVFTSNYRKLFVMTTNSEYLPDALCSRPSRVRYVVNYNDLSIDAINLILNDQLKDKKFIPEILNLVKKLEIISVDIVKSICEEVNIHNRADEEFFAIYNLERLQAEFSIYELENGTKKVAIDEVSITDLIKGRRMWDTAGEQMGVISDIDFNTNKITFKNSKITKTYFLETIVKYNKRFMDF